MDSNWVAFVVLLEEVFRTGNFLVEVLDQILCDFAGQLDTLSLSKDEMKLTEQSRTAYLEEIRQKEVRSEETVDERKWII